MSTFHLDTSGGVSMPRADKLGAYDWTYWSDLTPFAQGTLEAAAHELYERLRLWTGGMSPEDASAKVAFKNWSPSALGMILKDCEAWQADYPRSTDGARFWELRNLQLVRRPHFPPLLVSLGDDGLVYLTEGVKS